MSNLTLQAITEAAAEFLFKQKTLAKNAQLTHQNAWLSPALQTQTRQLVSDFGADAVWREIDAKILPSLKFPLLLVNTKQNIVLTDGQDQPAIDVVLDVPEIISLHSCKNAQWLGISQPNKMPVTLTFNDLINQSITHVLLISKRGQADERGHYLAPKKLKHWFWAEIWQHKSVLLSSCLFSVTINLLALATTLFTMSVYDRVIPNQAYVTLWSLAAGVTLAVILEQIAKHVRANALDQMGLQIDVILSQNLFIKAMQRKLEAKQNAVGTTVSILREFDAVRDFVASATLTLVADLPFIILFLFIISLVAGVLVWVPLVAAILIASICLIAQFPLAKLSQESLRESATRQGITVEALENIETLRAHDAEYFMQAKFNRVSQLAAGIGLRMRHLNHHVTGISTLIQQMTTIAVIIWGSYLIGDNKLSTGALFAAVILSGRAISPLHAIGALAMRFQHTRSALKSLNSLMQATQTAETERITKLHWGKQLNLQNVSFSYPSEEIAAVVPVLTNLQLNIQANEIVAVLGRVGCGKTTLLKLLAGLYEPTAGQVRLDDVAMQHINEQQLRQTITYVPQEVHLFIGTLRDNLLLGAQGVSDETILNLAALFALMPIISQHPKGLDMPVAEGGANFSIGQRGIISLVRALLRHPKFLLLDEPTAAMDLQLELSILNALKTFAAQANICLVIVTHRPAVVDIAQRLVVIDHAEIVADGDKATVLALLNSQQATVQANTHPPSSQIASASI